SLTTPRIRIRRGPTITTPGITIRGGPHVRAPRIVGGVGSYTRPRMAFLPRVLAAALLAIVLGGAPWSAVASDKQWTEYGRLPGDAPVFGLANDPTQPTTVYAATMGAGLLRTDDGQTWREVSKALPRRVWKLAVDAARDEQGFAPLYLGSTGGFY